MMVKKIRVVLADDHAIVRSCVRRILQRSNRIEVVGEAGNGVEALYLVNQCAPDVLLLDMEMPTLNGIEVARELCAASSAVKILALSAYDDQQYISEMLENGAAGYLTKDEAPEMLVEAVIGIARGERDWKRPQPAGRLAPSLQPR